MVLFPKHIFALFKRKGIMLMKRKTDKYTHCKRYEGKTTGRKIMDYHLKYSLAHSLRRDSALNRITTVQHKTIQHNMPQVHIFYKGFASRKPWNVPNQMYCHLSMLLYHTGTRHFWTRQSLYETLQEFLSKTRGSN